MRNFHEQSVSALDFSPASSDSQTFISPCYRPFICSPIRQFQNERGERGRSYAKSARRTDTHRPIRGGNARLSSSRGSSRVEDNALDVYIVRKCARDGNWDTKGFPALDPWLGVGMDGRLWEWWRSIPSSWLVGSCWETGAEGVVRSNPRTLKITWFGLCSSVAICTDALQRLRADSLHGSGTESETRDCNEAKLVSQGRNCVVFKESDWESKRARGREKITTKGKPRNTCSTCSFAQCVHRVSCCAALSCCVNVLWNNTSIPRHCFLPGFT